MIVDLERNDLGRIAAIGSVAVDELGAVVALPGLYHKVSTVSARPRAGATWADVLRATFPGGSITGAPKIRAMQIIDELEPIRRGPYGGGLGYVSLTGDMDIALALRTMVVPTAARDASRWLYHLQAAGGIVADSDTEAEYMETVNKAAALSRAIDLAEQAFGG